jgi:hypothetical protein
MQSNAGPGEPLHVGHVGIVIARTERLKKVCRVGHTAWKFDLGDICAGTNPTLID